MSTTHMSRRRFFCATTTAIASAATSSVLSAGKPPLVNEPRATDGDEVQQPQWDQQITISVGQQKGDLIGRDDKVIQAAVDYVARLGGGTVRILPGTYALRNSVYLPSKIRILGTGPESIVTKIASQSVDLSEDSDWYDQEITLVDGKDFRVGDGVVMRATNQNGGQEVIKRTLVARAGKRFKLSDGLRKNLWLSGKPTCASLFPLFTSEYTSDVVIENITFDGNKENNENFNGNYGGCIFLQDCNRYTIRGVETRNYNGDGISFQICHDVIVEDCHSHDNANLGVHPGSGSQRPLIRNNKLERNNLGLFWCWGVKYGLAENNTIDANRSYGVSIGHNDTDNVMRNNEITNSGKVGILFRDDSRGKDFWANRNTVVNNRVIDSGDEDGVAIDLRGRTRDVVIASNEIRETRRPMNRVGIRIDAQAGQITLTNNRIEGFDQPIVDARQV
jgi:hypothetical protein